MNTTDLLHALLFRARALPAGELEYLSWGQTPLTTREQAFLCAARHTTGTLYTIEELHLLAKGWPERAESTTVFDDFELSWDTLCNS